MSLRSENGEGKIKPEPFLSLRCYGALGFELALARSLVLYTSHPYSVFRKRVGVCENDSENAACKEAEGGFEAAGEP